MPLKTCHRNTQSDSAKPLHDHESGLSSTAFTAAALIELKCVHADMLVAANQTRVHPRASNGSMFQEVTCCGVSHKKRAKFFTNLEHIVLYQLIR